MSASFNRGSPPPQPASKIAGETDFKRLGPNGLDKGKVETWLVTAKHPAISVLSSIAVAGFATAGESCRIGNESVLVSLASKAGTSGTSR